MSQEVVNQTVVNEHIQLQQALNLSDQILSAIAEQKLDSVTRLDTDRRQVIDEYYRHCDSVDAELTQLLKQKNDEIISQLVKQQQQIREKQISLKQSSKISKAYMDNSR